MLVAEPRRPHVSRSPGAHVEACAWPPRCGRRPWSHLDLQAEGRTRVETLWGEREGEVNVGQVVSSAQRPLFTLGCRCLCLDCGWCKASACFASTKSFEIKSTK